MPELITPTARVHASFLAAMAEFGAEGRGVRDDVLEESPRPEGHVPATTLWWGDGTEYLGRLAIRHRLTPGLLEHGGHAGYDLRPSARRRGHATAMLGAALPAVRGSASTPSWSPATRTTPARAR